MGTLLDIRENIMLRLEFFMIICGIFVAVQTASAFSIDGEYSYKESGCSGNMEIKEVAFGMDPHIIAKINTVCTDQYHTCILTAKGGRMISSDTSISATFASIEDDGSAPDNPAKFQIEFTKNGATIDVSEKGGTCGLNGWFGGKYMKEGGKSKANTKKGFSIQSESLVASSDPAFKGNVELSKEFSACMDKSDGVTSNMLNCIAAETKRQDARLNKAYKEIMGQLSNERQKQLQNAQRLWIKYRDANCGFYADPDGGTSAQVSASECFMKATAERASELEGLTE
jgi:uncharacterized protein YecT (DUF1311 family)